MKQILNINTKIKIISFLFLIINILPATILAHNEDANSSKRKEVNDKNIIPWDNNRKLKQTDFRAKRKKVSGFAVATTASAFGYSITDNDGEITGNIYVQFYCKDSWWNPEFKNDENRGEILIHEQLHFDICELYGRKLFKEVLRLRRHGDLDFDSITKLSERLENEHSEYQDKYDHETNHSINTVEQKKWNKRIKKQLEEFEEYSNYSSF